MSTQGSGDPPGPLATLLAEHIARSGPIGFDTYVAASLYQPGLGFYQRGGGAGRRRDFITSPEVGPLFGRVMAGALDRWWVKMGRPTSMVLVEVGAGPGTLARAMRAAAPQCAGALHHFLVEVAEVQWTTHPEGVTTLAEFPRPADLPPGPVVVLANELLDNLPFALVEKTPAGWVEVGVGVEQIQDGSLVLVEVPSPNGTLPASRQAWCDQRAGDDAPMGARLPVHHEAAAWLGDALQLATVRGGRVVVFDYMATSAELARRPWTEWVRTYSEQGRAGHPLEIPGSCDITTEVAIDQLALVADPVRVWTQAQFLTHHGIADLVAEGDALWAESGIRGGREVLEAGSRRSEADALTASEGLGGFTVVDWEFPLP